MNTQVERHPGSDFCLPQASSPHSLPFFLPLVLWNSKTVLDFALGYSWPRSPHGWPLLIIQVSAQMSLLQSSGPEPLCPGHLLPAAPPSSLCPLILFHFLKLLITTWPHLVHFQFSHHRCMSFPNWSINLHKGLCLSWVHCISKA